MTGRTALVSGGARGIGAAVVRRLAAAGYGVVVADIDGEAARRLARELDTAEVVAAPTDVRDAEQCSAAVARAIERWGRLDVLVNNAGRNAYHEAVSMTEEEWDEVFSVDLKAVWLLSRAALPHLVEAGEGAIVNVSSIHGRLTTPGMFPYAAAKSGVEGLTRSLALDLAPRGVRVNAVAPGWTRTHLVAEWLARQSDPVGALARVEAAHPLGRMAEPDDVAAVVAFLASREARAVTGAVYPVDCGLSAMFSVG
ncbi:SDR family oxidoreductase [Herbiconiux sp. KACC 21604]|uniref:SDR family NAD(P)-dependent oxidoreductase n=1 Tax=unclassified Herbiconiux TaxID=2618217 RepID=UPI0020A278D6|nr:glucose 1-dehydrogenase [Herbiconiux sp. SALV-R1]WPO86387.1 SDR family oxidoreductase [Herbiconiux sp. KACC 21604]